MMALGKLGKVGTLTVALLLSLTAAQALDHDTAVIIDLNNAGVTALNHNDYELAIKKFEEALKLDPTYQLARDNLAIAYNNFGLQLAHSKNLQEALKQFHISWYLAPDNKTTKSNVDGVVQMLGKHPESFEDRRDLGLKAKEEGDFRGAIMEFRAALAIKDDPALHKQLGDLYREHGEPHKATGEYQTAKELGDDAGREVKRGQALQGKGEIGEALLAYQNAVAFKSDDKRALEALVAGWTEVVHKNPTAPANHLGLGKALQLSGDYDRAEGEYKQAISCSPNKENAAAQKCVDALPVARHNASAFKLINGAVDCQTSKSYDEAIRQYKQALDEEPGNVAAWFDLGTAYQAKGDKDQATRSYRKALSLDPKFDGAKAGLHALGETP